MSALVEATSNVFYHLQKSGKSRKWRNRWLLATDPLAEACTRGHPPQLAPGHSVVKRSKNGTKIEHRRYSGEAEGLWPGVLRPGRLPGARAIATLQRKQKRQFHPHNVCLLQPYSFVTPCWGIPRTLRRGRNTQEGQNGNCGLTQNAGSPNFLPTNINSIQFNFFGGHFSPASN